MFYYTVIMISYTLSSFNLETFDDSVALFAFTY